MMAPVDGSGSCPACRQIVLKRARDVSFTGRYDITTVPSSCSVTSLEPGTWNLEPGTCNREPGTWNREPDPRVLIAESRRRMLFYFLRSLAGRAIIVGVAIRAAVAIVGAAIGQVPRFLAIVDTVAGVAIAVGIGYFVFKLIDRKSTRLNSSHI